MKAYVINLNYRSDRLDHITKHLAELGVPWERIEAIEGKDIPMTEWRKQGNSKEPRWRAEHACYKSHMKAISRALNQNVFPCMILEDDCVLSEVPEPEPGMVYLGGFESSKGLFGFHAVMYNTRQDLLDFGMYARDKKAAIDAIGNNYRIICPHRVSKYGKGFIATQMVNYSDIEMCVVSRSAAGTVSKH